MKFQRRQFQHVLSKNNNFQLYLTKTMESPDFLSKGVWKFNIGQWLLLNTYSKLLMCALTTLHTSFNTHFFVEMHKLISLYLPVIITAAVDNFSNLLWGNCIEIPWQSKPFPTKTIIPVSYFWRTLLNVIVTWYFFITAVCYAECILP